MKPVNLAYILGWGTVTNTDSQVNKMMNALGPCIMPPIPARDVRVMRAFLRHVPPTDLDVFRGYGFLCVADLIAFLAVGVLSSDAKYE